MADVLPVIRSIMNWLKIAQIPSWAERILLILAIVLFLANVIITIYGFYKKRKKKVDSNNYIYNFEKEELSMFRECYKEENCIEGMLQKVLNQCSDKHLQSRVKKAIHYLEHDIFHDYETALFDYISDHTQECDYLFQIIIEDEIRKRNAESPDMPDSLKEANEHETNSHETKSYETKSYETNSRETNRHKTN